MSGVYLLLADGRLLKDGVLVGTLSDILTGRIVRPRLVVNVDRERAIVNPEAFPRGYRPLSPLDR